MPCYCCRRRGASACGCAEAFCARCGVCAGHCVCLIGDWVREDEDTLIEPDTPVGAAGGCETAAPAAPASDAGTASGVRR